MRGDTSAYLTSTGTSQSMEMDKVEELPPGFRFQPSDEEVIIYYLAPKTLDAHFSCGAMDELDVYFLDPWDLPAKRKNIRTKDNECWCFSRRDTKQIKGGKMIQAKCTTPSGYWKATSKDKDIFLPSRLDVLIGKRKSLVFYTGKPSKGGDKTPWIMHEYKLDGTLHHDIPIDSKDHWSVIHVFKVEAFCEHEGWSLANYVDNERTECSNNAQQQCANNFFWPLGSDNAAQLVKANLGDPITGGFGEGVSGELFISDAITTNMCFSDFENIRPLEHLENHLFTDDNTQDALVSDMLVTLAETELLTAMVEKARDVLMLEQETDGSKKAHAAEVADPPIKRHKQYMPDATLAAGGE